MTYGLPTVPESVRAHYAAKLPVESDTLDSIFAWIETFGDGMMTEGLHVGPLIALADKGDTRSILTLCVLYTHNQESWLWERMGFHALAGIQSRLSNSLILFARYIAP